MIREIEEIKEGKKKREKYRVNYKGVRVELNERNIEEMKEMIGENEMKDYIYMIE